MILYPCCSEHRLLAIVASYLIAAIPAQVHAQSTTQCIQSAKPNLAKIQRLPSSVRYAPDILLVTPNQSGPAEIEAGKPDDRSAKDQAPEKQAKEKAGWETAIEDVHGKVVRRIGEDESLVLVVQVPKGKISEAESQLSNSKYVRFIEKDVVCTANSHGYFAAGGENLVQWHLAPRYLNVRSTSIGAFPRVAVIDSGVDRSDRDLINVVRPFTNAGDLVDSSNHGSVVAALCAAECLNNYGGRSPGGGNRRQTTIYAVKVSSNPSPYVSEIISAIDRVTAKAHLPGMPRVINLSMGPVGDTFANPQYSSFHAAARRFYNKQGVMIVSAGNENKRFGYRRAGLFLSVAAVRPDGARASFSNYGTFIDCAAPGQSLVTTLRGSGVIGSGTSFAAPLVAGVVGAIQARHPRWTATQVMTATLSICRHPNGARGYNVFLGHGVPDMVRALSF